VDLFAAVERAGVRKLCLLHVSRDEKAAVRRYADTYRGALEIVWAEPGASIEV
jgi:ribonuclease BN (tRNA processing enzyme)